MKQLEEPKQCVAITLSTWNVSSSLRRNLWFLHSYYLNFYMNYFKVLELFTSLIHTEL